MWNFNTGETVRQTISKVMDVKGVRGLGKLMKEIAVTTSTGNHHHKLIGSASIVLKVNINKTRIKMQNFLGIYNNIIYNNIFSDPQQIWVNGNLHAREAKQAQITRND